ncbi:phage tail-collar fiber domain-containing protein [Serratia rhizosphaerae]
MTKYKAIVTTAGAAKIAAATAGGTQLKITHMAVGDGNGTLPEPTPEQTQLINEQYRAALNALDIANASQNHIVAELIIPANVGGFWLREMGLFDESGELIAVGNMAESYKPKLEEGSGRTQTLRMVLVVSSTDAIQVIAGGDTVLASRDFVEKAILEHEGSRNHPDATTTVKGFVMLSNATNSPSESKAVTPAALKQVSDAGLKKASNLSDLQNKEAARSNLALGTAAMRNVGTETGQLMAADEIDRRYLKKSGDTMDGSLELKSTIAANYYESMPDQYPEGSGAYDGQLNSKAPFYQPDFYWQIAPGGHYVPLVKGRSTRKNRGWPTAVSYGYLIPEQDMHAHPVIHAQGDSGVKCSWEFNTISGKITSKAGEFTPINETLNTIYPIGIVVLFANTTNPNTAFPGQRWEDLSAKGYDTRVLALGYNPLTTGGSNNVTISAHNLPDHSHKGGMNAPGKWYDTTVTGTDNSGNYKLGLTTNTYTDGTGNEFVRNEPLNVRNEYVHMRGWMRVG